jgi:hypothetical protein
LVLFWYCLLALFAPLAFQAPCCPFAAGTISTPELLPPCAIAAMHADPVAIFARIHAKAIHGVADVFAIVIPGLVGTSVAGVGNHLGTRVAVLSGHIQAHAIHPDVLAIKSKLLVAATMTGIGNQPAASIALVDIQTLAGRGSNQATSAVVMAPEEIFPIPPRVILGRYHIRLKAITINHRCPWRRRDVHGFVFNACGFHGYIDMPIATSWPIHIRAGRQRGDGKQECNNSAIHNVSFYVTAQICAWLGPQIQPIRPINKQEMHYFMQNDFFQPPHTGSIKRTFLQKNSSRWSFQSFCYPSLPQ